MPKRKRSFKTSRSRKRARSRAAKRVTVKVAGRGPIAPRTLTKLKYVDTVTSNGVLFDYVFNLNSVYDPNRTGTGHQPYGHDQYAALYNRYRVYKVKAIIKAVTISSTVGAAYKCTLLASNEASAFTNSQQAAECPGGYTKLLQSGMNTTFKMTYKLPKIVGQTSTQYKSDDRFQALTGADPSETICLHTVFAALNDTVAANGALSFVVTMVYYTEFFDPKDLAQS